jgi:hypothetical protein
VPEFGGILHGARSASPVYIVDELRQKALMTNLIAALTCFAFVVLYAQPASANAKDNPNFGYDSNGKPHADLQKYRREHAHGKRQGHKKPKHRAKACQGARNRLVHCVNGLF